MSDRNALPRTVVIFIVLVTALVGCSGEEPGASGIPPSPVSLAKPKQCDVCGMVIENHPGPSGQIFYERMERRSDTNPVQFDSLKHGLFPFYFEHKTRGWTPIVIYVTDYSRFDYEVRTIDGEPYIETAVAPNTFARARDAVYVVGSRVKGAMGKDFLPFSDRKEARGFIETYGGRLRAFEEITWQQVTQ